MGGQQIDTTRASSLVRLVVFSVDHHRYALDLASTERVLPMVAVSPLPGCPDVVLGAINVHGEVVPVFDVRRRMRLGAVEYGPTARLLLARTARRLVALPVDDVIGVTELPAEAVMAPDQVLPDIDHISGIGALADGVLLIQDLDAFLSIDEERQLEASLEKEQR